MNQAYDRLHEAAVAYHTGWRTAAYIVALTRLARVYKERDIFL